MSSSRKHTIKIRRKRGMPEEGEGLNLQAVESMIDLKLQPLLNTIDVLQINTFVAGVILEDIKNTVALALSDTGSTRSRLQELLDNLSGALSNMKHYSRTAEEQDIVNMATENLLDNDNNYEESDDDVDDYSDYDDEGDDIISNVSDSVEEIDPVAMRDRPPRRTRRNGRRRG